MKIAMRFGSVVLFATFLVCGVKGVDVDKEQFKIGVDDKDKVDVLEHDKEEAGAGDNKEFTINTDDNISALESGDEYRTDDKLFYRVASISAKGDKGGSFVFKRVRGSSDYPAQKFMRVAGKGPLTIASRLTLVDIYLMGGPFLHPIALLALATIVLGINCLMLYRSARQCPPKFVEAARAALNKGDMDSFEELALKEKWLFPQVCRAMAEEHETSTADDVKERVAAVAGVQVNKLKIPVKALNLIAAAAPLLGLLGTIIGMVLVFDAVANAGGASKAQALAAGIRVKLFSTAAALMVAIPSLFMFFIFNQKLNAIVADCEVLTESFLQRISLNKRKAKAKAAKAERSASENATVVEKKEALA